MIKIIGAILLLISSTTTNAADFFLEFDHYSKPLEYDLGLTMVNVGVEGCIPREVTGELCFTGKLGTPVFDNDMYRLNNGMEWETGDLGGNVGVRWYFR